MRYIIVLEYIINFILICFYHLHMFQLNSYFTKKHVRWIKHNFLVILSQIALILFPTVLYYIKSPINEILCSCFLFISIIYNIPKKKSKIPLKVTNRVKRLLITELILSIILLNKMSYYLIIKLCVLNIMSIILSIIANFINTPIEALNRKRYINQAKEKLKQMPDLIVIGITGSYGKTSVKNYLCRMLSSKYNVFATPKNYNTTMGIVKTIREDLKPIHQIFICEMGATHIGDIKEICDIVEPKIGIITAIGPQHLESFKSIDNIIKTKFELMDSVTKNNGITFLNYNNEYIAKQDLNKNILTYGVDNENLDYNSFNLTSSSRGLSFTLSSNKSKEKLEFKTKLIGKHNVINLTGAIGIANYLGIPLNKIVNSVREIKNVEHRLELIPHGNLNIIDDSYNSNPISSKSALDTLAEFEGTKIIVTPGLIELGKDEEKYNFELGKYMVNICDYIFLVNSKSAKYILEGINSMNFNEDKIFIVNTPQEAMQHISQLNINNKVTVLLENDLPDNYNI